MKGYFSLKLYIEGLKRIKIPGIAAAISVIFLNAILPMNEILSGNRRADIIGNSVSAVSTYEFLPFGLLMLAFGAIFAYSMFSFLNERNRSDFYHAIPHKRICVYLSFVAAMATWIFGILAVSTGINALLFAFAKFSSVNISVVFITPLVMMLASIMVAAFMTLAMTLTGTTVSNVLIFILVLLFGRTVGQIFVTALREITPILRSGSSFLEYLEFEFSLPFALLTGEGFDNTPLIIYTVFVTILVLAVGALCYVKRRSETATKSAPSKLMQHVYRSAISLPFFLFIVLIAITDGYDASTQLILLVLALLVYCIFELMTTKKIKALVRSLPMILIPILLSGVFTGMVFIARNAVLDQLPSVDEVEAISEKSPINYYNPTYQTLRISDAFVDSEEAKEIVLGALSREITAIREGYTSGWAPIIGEDGNRVETYTKLTLQIRLKNGRTLGRYIGFTEKEYNRLMDIMMESEDYLEAYIALPKNSEINTKYLGGYDFSKEETERLWNSFVNEYNSLSNERKKAYLAMRYSSDELNSFHVVGTYRLQSFSSTYRILFEYLPRTSRLYLEMATEKGIIVRDKKILEAMIEELSHDNIDYENKNLNIIATVLTGKDAGEEFFIESLKTDTKIPKEDAVKILQYLVDHGEFSYDESDLLVRFSVQLYGWMVYDMDADSYYSMIISSVHASEVAVESGDIFYTRLVLSLSEDEWKEFKTMTEPYRYS